MARFDVYALTGTSLHVLDVQCDLLSSLSTRVVVPLREADDRFVPPIERLCPAFTLDGKRVVLRTPEISAIPVGRLGPCVGNLEAHRQIIIDALDFLMQGF